jgi:dGTPase
LGHPPFGHIAEEALDKLAEKHGGFEGNAQSFRILTKLAFRSADYRGLDLTRATLAAVLKYPWFREGNPKKLDKFGAYETERRDFEFARELYPNSQAQTIEAALMDWADDITYPIHDLEDFYRAGRMPLHLLGNRDPSERQYFFADVFERRLAHDAQLNQRRRDLEEAFTDTLVTTFPTMRSYSGSEAQRIGLRNFTGTLIGRYINGVDLIEKDGRLQARIKPEYTDEVFMLKQLTWTYVIEAPSLATQQWGLKQKIRRLFGVYTEAAASSKEWKLFPVYYQERLKQAAGGENEFVRVCVDLIASMTENQVHKIFGRLTGSSSGASLDDPLQ